MEQRRIKPGSDEGGREPPEARHPPAEAPDKPPAAVAQSVPLPRAEPTATETAPAELVPLPQARPKPIRARPRR